MIEAEMADGTVLEFPDGTPPTAIQRAVKAHIGGAGAHTGGLPPATPQLAALQPAGAAGAPARSPVQPAAPAPLRQEMPEAPGSWWGPNNGPLTQEARQAYFKQRGDAAFTGAKDQILKMTLGAKQIFGGLDEEDKNVLRQMETETRADPFGKNRDRAGTLTNLALTAYPAGKAANAVASVLPRTLAPVAAGAAVSGGQAALLDIGKGDTYGEQMADKGRQARNAAVTGGGVALGGQLLTKTLTKPFTPTAEAERLMAENVNPTLQQGAESPVGRFIGGLTSGAMDVKNRQNREVMGAMLRRIAPGLDTSAMTIPEKVTLLRQRFEGDPSIGSRGEFGDFFDGKKFTMSNSDRSAVWQSARTQPPGAMPEATQNAMGAMAETGPALNSQAPVRMGLDKLEQYRGMLQDAADKYRGTGVIDTQTRQALQAARGRFDEIVRNRGLNVDQQAQLADLDQRYSDFLRFQDAATKPGFHARPSVNEVMRSHANMAEGNQFAEAQSPVQRELLEPASRTMGLTPTQDEARTIIATMKRVAKLGAPMAAGAMNPMVGAALAPLYATSLAGQTATGARYLFGQNDWQKAMADAIRKGAPYGAGAGQSLSGEQYAP